MKVITTIEEVQEYLPVQMTSDIYVISPFINNAERSYLAPLIGLAQFIALEQAYIGAGKDVTAIADPQIRTAVELCQNIVTTIAYYHAVPVLSVKIGSSGIQVFSNTDTKQAFSWQVEELREQLLTLGYGAIEDLLLHMEQNADKFQPYIDSDQYIDTEQFLIESASDFSKYFNINKSRYIFQSINYIMLRIENQVVAKLIGSDFLQFLKDDKLEGKNAQLANQFIKPGIALLTAAKAIIERVITFEGGVARINIISSYEASKKTMVATRDQVKDVKEQLEADGNQFLQDGLQFILDNATDFPEYIAPASSKNYNIKNNPKGGLFAV